MKRLFTLRLKKTETVKGSDMLRVEYAFESSDGEDFLGGTWKMINDADSRREVETTVWAFDGEKKRFARV